MTTFGTLNYRLIILAGILSYSSQVLAYPKVYYVNGMSTSKWEAKDEMEILRKTIRKKSINGNRHLVSYWPILMYSKNTSSDFKNVLWYERKMKKCVYSTPRRYSRTLKSNCKNLRSLIKNLSRNIDNYNGVQLLSYSRGNLISNIAMNQLGSRRSKGQYMKRISIASPAKYNYGKVFTTSSDQVVGKFTNGAVTKNPDYYYYNLTKKQKKRFNRSWLYTRKYNAKYFGSNFKKGHNLRHCYLDSDSLDEDISQAASTQFLKLVSQY